MSLKVPVRKKFRKNGGNEILTYGVAAMQGYREQMEDAHVTLEDFDVASGTSFFAVYDGHGGPAVAKYCANHLHTELRAHEEFLGDLETAVQDTFLRMDVMLGDRVAAKELCKYDGKNGPWKEYKRKLMLRRFIRCLERPTYDGPINDGCTACVTLIRGNHITVGNAGDSRCVISRNGQAIDLSTDHKPDLPAERERIQNAGRQITQLRGPAFRIDNGIAIARAIGDLSYKDNATLGVRDQAVTAFPEVRTEEITADTEFMVIACDGIWDCMTSQQVVDFIKIYMDHAEPADVCASLLDLCLTQPRGIDNMSIILVIFKREGKKLSCRLRRPRPPHLPPLPNPPDQPSPDDDQSEIKPVTGGGNTSGPGSTSGVDKGKAIDDS